MKRCRCLPFVALLLLLASLCSTETAEVWCRVAVGASASADDDDGPYFTCRPSRNTAQVGGPVAVLSAADGDSRIVDEPAFCLPQFDAVVRPAPLTRPIVTAEAITRASETRGPPAWTGRFVRPPPRGPPLS